MKFLLPLLLVIVSFQLKAQDIITKKDKTTLTCKVVEIGLEEVKYIDANDGSGILISIAIDDIQKITLASGREIIFTDPLNDPNTYINDRKRAIKFHFLSPLVEHLGLSYEQVIKPGRSFETELGIIGVGFDTDTQENGSGAFIGLGLKFFHTPDYHTKRYKYAHILKGGYIKPQIIISYYRIKDYLFGNPAIEKNILAGAFMLNFGKQHVFDNIFLIDYSFGLGYAFHENVVTNYDSYSYREYHYGFLATGESPSLAIAAKLKLGFLLN